VSLIYKNEKRLFTILLLISLAIWGGLIVGTSGIVLVYIASFFIFYLFAQAGFISYLKGTAVEITPEQFPDLHKQISDSSQKLQLPKVPEAYLLHADGAFNALATRFLGRNFIVLFSDVVDALDAHPDALNFYIGHEIGHIKRNHLLWGPVVAPAAILPLLGAAYSRSREYTCDRHGLAACHDPASATLGLAALAAGGNRWRTVNIDRYVLQARDSSGFWMSLHELISDYPWLTKRVAAVQTLAKGNEPKQPARHPIAWLLALFVPRLGVGGGAGSGIVTIAVIGILAAIAIPAYQDYQVRGQLNQAVLEARVAANAVTIYYQTNKSLPQTLEQAGYAPQYIPQGVQPISLDANTGTIKLTIDIPAHLGKTIELVPSIDDNKQIVWRCGSSNLDSKLLPLDCRD